MSYSDGEDRNQLGLGPLAVAAAPAVIGTVGKIAGAVGSIIGGLFGGGKKKSSAEAEAAAQRSAEIRALHQANIAAINQRAAQAFQSESTLKVAGLVAVAGVAAVLLLRRKR